MDRETLLAKGYTEEQVTELLNMFHGRKSETEELQRKLDAKTKELTGLYEIKKEFDDMKRATMTREEKIAEAEKAALAKEQAAIAREQAAEKIYNVAKAKQILSDAGISDGIDTILDRITVGDEASTIASANEIATLFKSKMQETELKTKEQLLKTDIKPSGSNVQPGAEKVTMESFAKMTVEEQNKFATENAQEFKQLFG